jgi:hypothetical protein
MSAAIENLRISLRAMRAIDDAAARRAALAADAYDELLAEFFAAVEAGDASAVIRTPDYGYDSAMTSRRANSCGSCAMRCAEKTCSFGLPRWWPASRKRTPPTTVMQ